LHYLISVICNYKVTLLVWVPALFNDEIFLLLVNIRFSGSQGLMISMRFWVQNLEHPHQWM